jgi:tetratricopeptide (TPR) repeat protein
VDFTIKAVSVQQGLITFTKTYSGSARDSSCRGDGKSGADLQNEAIWQVLEGMRRDVAPYTVMVSIEFMDDDDVMDSATRRKVKNAMEYAEQKRVDRACEIFKEAVAGSGKSPALYYNLGVCAEIASDFDRAETLYDKADRLSSKPVELISQALIRVRLMKSNQQAVSQQLR